MRTRTLILGSLGGLLAAPLSVLGAMQLVRKHRYEQMWRSLETTSSGEVFSESMVADLPSIAQCYFLHAIQPGTPLASSIEIDNTINFTFSPEMEPETYKGKWIVNPYRGAFWGNVSQTKPFWLREVAYYFPSGAAEEGAIVDLIPVRYSLNDPKQMDKLFRARIAHQFMLIPSALLPQHGTVWEAIDDDHARVTVTIDGDSVPLTLRIDSEGRLCEMTFEQWNIKGTGTDHKGADGYWRFIPCGVTVDGERTIGGYTIPSRYTFQMWYKSNERGPGLTNKYTLDRARFS